MKYSPVENTKGSIIYLLRVIALTESKFFLFNILTFVIMFYFGYVNFLCHFWLYSLMPIGSD